MECDSRSFTDQLKHRSEQRTRFVRRCYRCNAEFEVIGAIRSGSASSLTCSDACRTAVSRRRSDLVFAGAARAVACILEGERVVAPPPFWGLFRALVDRERALIRASKQARRLPGGERQ